jgi:hypothetical protein
VAEVLSVDGDSSLGWIVEAMEKIDHRCLASSCRTHDGDELARLPFERDIGEHWLTGIIGEADPFDADMAND